MHHENSKYLHDTSTVMQCKSCLEARTPWYRVLEIERFDPIRLKMIGRGTCTLIPTSALLVSDSSNHWFISAEYQLIVNLGYRLELRPEKGAS